MNEIEDVTSAICQYRAIISEIWNLGYFPGLKSRDLRIEAQEGYLEACAHIFGAMVLNISDHNSYDLRLPSRIGYPTSVPAKDLFAIPDTGAVFYYQDDCQGILESREIGELLPYVDLYDYDEFGLREFEYAKVLNNEKLGFIKFDKVKKFIVCA